MAKSKKNFPTPGKTSPGKLSAKVGYDAQLWQMAAALRGARITRRVGVA